MDNDVENMKRRSIKSRIMNTMILISAISLIICSVAGIYAAYRTRDMSEEALVSQMLTDMLNVGRSKAIQANENLGYYSNIMDDFVIYIEQLYKHPGDYLGKKVELPDKKNAGKLVLQIVFAEEGMQEEDYLAESVLLSNVKHIIHPVMTSMESEVAVVYVASERGFLISYDKNSDMNNDTTVYDFFSTGWYQEAKESQGIIFTDVYDDSFGRGPTITVAAPYHDENGNFAGVVGMDILIADMYKRIVTVDPGVDETAEGMEAYVVDRSEHIISEDGKSRMLADDEGMDENVRKMIMSGDIGYDVSSKNVLYAFAPIGYTGWRLCLKVSESYILGPVYEMDVNIFKIVWLIIGVFIATLIMVLIISTKLSKNLVKPIDALRHDAKEIAGGNLDHRADVIRNDEIGDLAKAFNDMAGNLKKYIADLTTVTKEKERIGAELDVATKIQADMLPRTFPIFPDRDDLDVFASMDPAKEVGGDFYDIFMIDDNHVGLVMADVSGKGVPAALFMVIAKTLIKNHLQNRESVEEVLAVVNNQLSENNDEMLFVTAWIASVDLTTWEVEYSDSGHEFPMLMHADGRVEEIHPMKKRPPLAAMEGMVYFKDTLSMEVGDKLFLYTDGVPEATSADRELYGMERLSEVLKKHYKDNPDDILVAVRQDVDAFVGDADQFDDLTMLAFERKA